MRQGNRFDEPTVASVTQRTGCGASRSGSPDADEDSPARAGIGAEGRKRRTALDHHGRKLDVGNLERPVGLESVHVGGRGTEFAEAGAANGICIVVDGAGTDSRRRRDLPARSQRQDARCARGREIALNGSTAVEKTLAAGVREETMTDAFNERLRLIRFRRKRERSRFRDELRIIPKWLVVACVALYFVALCVGMIINVHGFITGGPVFPGDDGLRSEPLLSCLALAGVITGVAAVFSCLLFMLGYVYRDAQRRGMHPALWTILVLILSGGYFLIGLIIYLLVREPLPYTCPQCASTVNARFNFCPSCKYNLHPACPQCQREVDDEDKFCPYCASELHHAPKLPGEISTDSSSV